MNDSEFIKVGIINNPPQESGYRSANVMNFASTFIPENGYMAYNSYLGTHEAQIAAFNQYVNMGVDYILLSAATTAGWDNAIKSAKNAGIPVLLFDRMIDNDGYTAAVVSDMAKQGEMAVEWLLGEYLDEYNVIHLQGVMGSDAQIGRTTALNKAALDKSNNITILSQQTANWSADQAKAIVQGMINKPKGVWDKAFNVIYAENDDMALGAMNALKDAGISYGIDEDGNPKDVIIMGFDCNEWALQYLLNGDWNFSGQCSPFQADILDKIIKDLEKGIQPINKKIISDERIFDAKQTSGDSEILNDFDVNNIDMFKIKDFLLNGREKEAPIVMQNIVEEIGKNNFESLLIRHYITMHIYIACRTFADSIGVSKTEFEKSCGGPIVLSKNVRDVKTTANYLTKLLEQCIAMRCDIFSKTSADVIKQAKEHILKNYADSAISLTSVAKVSCVSPAYFSTIFKKNEGVAFTDYLNKIRIQKAKELLVISLKNISEIAFEVGFNDSKYFSQLFKKYYGMSPKEYRHKNQSH